MSYTCRFHPHIQQDFDDAYAWYENEQEGLGERFIKAVRLKIEEIALQPEVYGSRGNKRFREAKVDFFPYLIIYKLKRPTKELYITSIHHTKKHPKKKYRK